MWTPLKSLNDIVVLIIDLQQLDVDPTSGALAAEPPEIVTGWVVCIAPFEDVADKEPEVVET